MKCFVGLLMVISCGLCLADKPATMNFAFSGVGVPRPPAGAIEKAFLDEDAFPLTREVFKDSYQRAASSIGSRHDRVTPGIGIRVTVPAMQPTQAIDFDSLPIKKSNERQPIDAPIHFDAQPTLSVSYLR